jgi:hypothetical protein
LRDRTADRAVERHQRVGGRVVVARRDRRQDRDHASGRGGRSASASMSAPTPRPGPAPARRSSRTSGTANAPPQRSTSRSTGAGSPARAADALQPTPAARLVRIERRRLPVGRRREVLDRRRELGVGPELDVGGREAPEEARRDRDSSRRPSRNARSSSPAPSAARRPLRDPRRQGGLRAVRRIPRGSFRGRGGRVRAVGAPGGVRRVLVVERRVDQGGVAGAAHRREPARAWPRRSPRRARGATPRRASTSRISRTSP